MDKSHLARLADSLAVRKPARAKELSGFVDGVVEACEQEQAAGWGAGSSLSWHAVDDNYIIRVIYTKIRK